MEKFNKVSSTTWQNELSQSAFKYHYLIALVAVILNPLWAVADFLTIPSHFWDFFYFRLIVSLMILLTLFSSSRFTKKPEIIALVPFIGISIQNAYMYSVMEIPEIQKHTFAYITLFIGAGMFVLWNIRYSIIVVIISLLANLTTFSIFGKLKIEEVMVNGGLLTFTVSVFTIFLIQTRTQFVRKEIISRLALAEKNQIIEEQKADYISSINYAQRIQKAFLPSEQKMDQDLENYFILYVPKDIVSGDFYWYSKVQTSNKGDDEDNLSVIAAVDCTGHGVPGAFMSIFGNTILNQSIKVRDVNTPAEALGFLNYQLIQNLNSIKDGMDIALIAIDFKKLQLQYAGANNPLYIVRDKQLIEIKADKKSIGGDFEINNSKTFTNHLIDIQKNDMIYIFTDGFADQFGGPESYIGGKKFKYKNFKNTLINISELEMEDQKNKLFDIHNSWKRNLEQVDDILVMGIKI